MKELKAKKLFLLDMDGTIYLGNILFDGTIDFLNHIKEKGNKYYYITNNSSKGIADYVKKLSRMGISAKQEEFVTSVQVTVNYLLDNYKNVKIYVLGSNSLKEELSSKNLDITDKYEADIGCVVLGFDTELSFSKLEDVCRILLGKADAGYIATNPDLVCPTEYGYVPDCGSIAQILFNATGRSPKFIGKPEPQIIEQALKISGYKKEEAILIGDRLYTDIACGLRAGMDTALVLSGETKAENLEKSEYKPTWVFKDINEILTVLSD